MLRKKILTILLVSWSLCSAKSSVNSETVDLCQLKAKYGAMAASEKDNSLPPSLQLLKMMLLALQDVSLTYINKAKHISDQLLKDPVLKENNSAEVKEFLEKIKNFEERYSTCSDINDLFQLVVLYSTASSEYYDKEEKNTLTDEGKEILEVLKKYKSIEIDDEFEKTFLEFVTKFAQKIEEVKDKLKEEKIGDKIFKWWDNVKELKTYEEKMEAFSKYANLYEMN